ncbi:MAG: beta-1,6-N-acetylglucosaminyltransferase [Bacteroidales bacterium]|jgi:hypothetical protein
MKLVYLILAHKEPEQLFRLLSRLSSDDTIFVIHFCKKSSNKIFREIKNKYCNHKNVFFCKRGNGAWGEVGIVKAVFHSIVLLNEKNINYDYFNVISAQDYPLKSNENIKKYFKDNYGKQFLKYWKMLPAENGEYAEEQIWKEFGVRRIEKRRMKIFGKYFYIPDNHYMPHNFFVNLKIFIFEIPKKIGEKTLKTDLMNFILSAIFPKHRNFPEGIEPYGGSQWWSVTKDCAEYILEFYKKNKFLIRFYKRTLLSDEMFAATCLMNSRYKSEIVNDNLRYIVFNENSSHPKTFTINDFEELMNSKKLFARKFETNIDNEILKLIDKTS